MEHRRLGRSGLKVSAVGIGCNNFGGRMDGGDAGGRRRGHRLRASRCSTRPTCTATSNRKSARRSARRQAPARDRCDEVRRCRWADVLERGGSRRYIVQAAVEASLMRLGTDYIDLYQIHAPGCRDADRGDARALGRSRASRQGALHRLLEFHRLADRRCRLDRARRAAALVRVRAESLQSARAQRSKRKCCRQLRALRPRHAAVLPARERHADRKIPAATNRRRKARVSQTSVGWRSAR